MRRASSVYWTPVEVAVRAAKLLVVKPGATILDIGAGIGKFCIVAAATETKAHVLGVEHRPHLVEVAREAAAMLGVDVDIREGTIDEQEPRAIDGIYLFNPFGENLCAKEDRLDESVSFSAARFRRDVELTERFLSGARAGTRVVTYCGWGGSMPPEYYLALREQRAGTIELWVKSDAGDH